MWIDTVRIEGGVLSGLDQRFNRKLNVLIGGRGTGKSSLVELIRFCLGAVSYTSTGQQEATEHALGVLGDGRVTVTLTDGKQHVEVSRTAQDTEANASAEFPSPFVFSQSEIETVGLHAQSRLRLIDGFLSPDLRSSADSGLGARIRSATIEVRTLLAEIDDISEKTSELAKLEALLINAKAQTEVQTQTQREIEVHRTALSELTPLLAAARVRSETIRRTADQFASWADQFEALLERKPSIEPWPVQAGTRDELLEARKRERQAETSARASFDEFRAIISLIEDRKTIAINQRAGFENRARDIRQKIEERQKGASAIDKKISDLTQQVSVLRSLVDLRKQRETRVRQITEQRTRYLAAQEHARLTRTKRRESVASRLSEALGPSVRITMIPYSQTREYISTLAKVLRGSGLRYNDLAERIAETYSPQEIATLAELRDIQAVATTLEISPERALRLCDALRGQEGAALFTTNVEDDVRIQLMDGADYKGIDFLSMGQRCTAILPIILRHTERIIILDQPEDHLDNAFVVGTLVKAIMARSSSAQTIVASHNPNIPVLGDAAQVFHLDSDGSRCFVRSAGSLDSPRIVDAITTIMEGGREAFMKRARFYAKSTPNATQP